MNASFKKVFSVLLCFSILATLMAPAVSAAPAADVTDISVEGTQGNDGWYTSDVTLTPVAPGSLISSNGSDWQQSIVVKGDRTSPFTYYLKDADGQESGAKKITLKIDKTAPRIRSGSAFKDGGIYCKTVSGGIVEEYFDKILVDGEPIRYTQDDYDEIKYYFTINTAGSHTVEVYDKAGNVLTANITVNEDHVYGDLVQTKAPSCTVRGNWEKQCIYCIHKVIISSTDAEMDQLHDWNEPTFEWAEDGSSATASFTCNNSELHAKTLDAEITSEVVTPATCVEPGETKYTATVELQGQTYTDEKIIKDIPISAEHAWEEPQFVWANDGSLAYAEFVCGNSSEHNKSVVAEVTSEVVKAATCTEPGETKYTATVEMQGQTYTDVKIIKDIPAIAHSLTKVDATQASETKEGNIEYYICGDCKKAFLDAEGKTEISLEDTVLPKVEVKVVKGDANADGKVGIVDAKLVLKYVAQMQTLSDKEYKAADMNNDGNVTVVDAKLILKLIAGINNA